VLSFIGHAAVFQFQHTSAAVTFIIWYGRIFMFFSCFILEGSTVVYVNAIYRVLFWYRSGYNYQFYKRAYSADITEVCTLTYCVPHSTLQQNNEISCADLVQNESWKLQHLHIRWSLFITQHPMPTVFSIKNVMISDYISQVLDLGYIHSIDKVLYCRMPELLCHTMQSSVTV